MKKSLNLAIIFIISAFVVTSFAVTFFVSDALAQTFDWVGPTEQPPGGNPPGFIYNSDTEQTGATFNITGDAIVGSLFSNLQICLPDTDGDPSNDCITSFDDGSIAGGKWFDGAVEGNIYYDEGIVSIGTDGALLNGVAGDLLVNGAARPNTGGLVVVENDPDGAPALVAINLANDSDASAILANSPYGNGIFARSSNGTAGYFLGNARVTQDLGFGIESAANNARIDMDAWNGNSGASDGDLRLMNDTYVDIVNSGNLDHGFRFRLNETSTYPEQLCYRGSTGTQMSCEFPTGVFINTGDATGNRSLRTAVGTPAVFRDRIFNDVSNNSGNVYFDDNVQITGNVGIGTSPAYPIDLVLPANGDRSRGLSVVSNDFAGESVPSLGADYNVVSRFEANTGGVGVHGLTGWQNCTTNKDDETVCTWWGSGVGVLGETRSNLGGSGVRGIAPAASTLSFSGEFTGGPGLLTDKLCIGTRGGGYTCQTSWDAALGNGDEDWLPEGAANTENIYHSGNVAIGNGAVNTANKLYVTGPASPPSTSRFDTRVGIGTNPSQALHVNGAVKIDLGGLRLHSTVDEQAQSTIKAINHYEGLYVGANLEYSSGDPATAGANRYINGQGQWDTGGALYIAAANGSQHRFFTAPIAPAAAGQTPASLTEVARFRESHQAFNGPVSIGATNTLPPFGQGDAEGPNAKLYIYEGNNERLTLTIHNNSADTAESRAQICLNKNDAFCLAKRGNNGDEDDGGNDGVLFWNAGNGDYVWRTNSTTEVFRIRSNGNVGIGAAVPGERLHVVSPNRNVVRLDGNTEGDWLGLSIRSTSNVEDWFVGNRNGGDFVIRRSALSPDNDVFRINEDTGNLTYRRDVDILGALSAGSLSVTSLTVDDLTVNGGAYIRGGTGDVNNDGVITSAGDVQSIANFLIGNSVPTDAQLARADIDGDGVISYSDYHYVIQTTLNTPRTNAWKVQPYGMRTDNLFVLRPDVSVSIGDDAGSSYKLSVKNTNASLEGVYVGSANRGVVVEAGADAIVGETITGRGVTGISDSWDGVAGFSESSSGVAGFSESSFGVYASSNGNLAGLYARSTNGSGIYAESSNGNAADFNGDVNISGGGDLTVDGDVRISSGTLELDVYQKTCSGNPSPDAYLYCSCDSGYIILNGGAKCNGLNEHMWANFPLDLDTWRASCHNGIIQPISNVSIQITCIKIQDL